MIYHLKTFGSLYRHLFLIVYFWLKIHSQKSFECWEFFFEKSTFCFFINFTRMDFQYKLYKALQFKSLEIILIVHNCKVLQNYYCKAFLESFLLGFLSFPIQIHFNIWYKKESIHSSWAMKFISILLYNFQYRLWSVNFNLPEKSVYEFDINGRRFYSNVYFRFIIRAQPFSCIRRFNF